MKTCSSCHKEFSVDMQFCPYCGQREGIEMQNKTEKRIAILSLIGILGLGYSFVFEILLSMIAMDFDKYAHFPLTGTAFVIGGICFLMAHYLRVSCQQSSDKNAHSQENAQQETPPFQDG